MVDDQPSWSTTDLVGEPLILSLLLSLSANQHGW
jgi:hypothetical protein